MSKIAAIVVTYNKEDLLLQCLDSIVKQTKPVDAIFIIDNQSSESTAKALFEVKYIRILPTRGMQTDQILKSSIKSSNINDEDIEIIYILKHSNDGGAGGFFYGQKLAYDMGYDWLWFMDDDGMAEKNQLKILIDNSNRFKLKYSNALVINRDDYTELAFDLNGCRNVADVIEQDVIYDHANPFNGTLICRELIHKIGFIKREMFIWGDESEYMKRVKKFGEKIATIVPAKHYHPKNQGNQERVFPFYNRYKVTIKPSNRSHIYYRNLAFINSQYEKKSALLRSLLLYSLFYISRFRIVDLFEFWKHSLRGIKNDFS
jgi:rhamnopyranosyl-N-acetylglucosaminyl-diphospho-decaprenol beta-1,3/1,4-galactofuranosyltransferase